jgi:hypothetical protein
LRTLEGRAALGLELVRDDRQLLRALGRLLYHGRQAPEGLERTLDGGVSRARRMGVDVPVRFRLGAGPPCEGLLRDLSADGAFVETDQAPAEGERFALHLRDPEEQREYHFACEVIRHAPGGMGLRLLGVPVECRYLNGAGALGAATAA